MVLKHHIFPVVQQKKKKNIPETENQMKKLIIILGLFYTLCIAKVSHRVFYTIPGCDLLYYRIYDLIVQGCREKAI